MTADWRTWVIGYVGTFFVLIMLVDAGPGTAELAVALAALITTSASFVLLPSVLKNLGLQGGVDVFGIKAGGQGGLGAGREPIGRIQRQPDYIAYGRQFLQLPAGSIVRDISRVQVQKAWN